MTEDKSAAELLNDLTSLPFLIIHAFIIYIVFATTLNYFLGTELPVEWAYSLLHEFFTLVFKLLTQQ